MRTVHPESANRPEFVPIAIAAERCDCSSKTIRRMIADGKINGYRFGARMLRVDLHEVYAAHRKLPTAGGPR